MKTKVLVTGANGFIGSHVCEMLKKETIEYYKFEGDCVRIIDWDNNLACCVTGIKKDFTHVVHFGSFNGGIEFSSKYPADIFTKNTQMILAGLDSCISYEVPYFLTLVTSCGYPASERIGGLDDTPYVEDEYLQGKPHPTIEAHGFAKRNVLLACKFYNQQYGIKALCLCPNTVFGPNDRTDERSKVMMALIKKFVDAKRNDQTHVVLWGTGHPMREFIYIKDLVGIIKTIIRRSNGKYTNIGFPNDGLLNIGATKFLTGSSFANALASDTNRGTCEISIRDLAFLIAEAVEYSGAIYWDTDRPDGASRKALSYSIQGCRSLRPKHLTSMVDGIQETVRWYEKEVTCDS